MKLAWEANTLFERLHLQLESHHNPAYALAMKAYMKGNFEFFGIKSPQVKDIVKEIFTNVSKPNNKGELWKLIEKLWSQEKREYQYVACQLLKKYTKMIDSTWKEEVEYLTLHKSWWDSVDFVAAHVAGMYMQAIDPQERMNIASAWNVHYNMWMRRVSLLFQVNYKKDTDFDLLQALILNVANEKEFFIRKAAGWALRSYSRFNPAAVLSFVDIYETQMSGLTKREALRLIN